MSRAETCEIGLSGGAWWAYGEFSGGPPYSFLDLVGRAFGGVSIAGDTFLGRLR